MQKIGEVEFILNERFAIIKTLEPVILGSEVLIYVEKKITENEDATIQIPKGKLKIVMIQGENRYLASTITKKFADDNQTNVSLARSLSIFGTLFNNDKKNEGAEDSKDQPANYSAKLDTTDAIGLDLNPLVGVGDLVSIR